jgi:hypothetical protein
LWLLKNKNHTAISNQQMSSPVSMTSTEKKGPGRPKKVWTEEELAAKEVEKAAKAAVKAAAKAEEKALAKVIKDAEKAAAKEAAAAAKAAGLPVVKAPKVPKVPKATALADSLPSDTAELIAEIKKTHAHMTSLLALLG